MVKKKMNEGEKPTDMIAAVLRNAVYVAVGILIGTII